MAKRKVKARFSWVAHDDQTCLEARWLHHDPRDYDGPGVVSFTAQGHGVVNFTPEEWEHVKQIVDELIEANT